ncbi:MAG: Hpt domain-containing protein [Chitinophagales bacterium]
MLQLGTDVDFTSHENEGFFEIKNIAKNNSLFEEQDTSQEEIPPIDKNSLPTYSDITDKTISTPTEGYLFNENYVLEEDVLNPKQDPSFCEKNTPQAEELTSMKDSVAEANNSVEEKLEFDPDTYLQHLREMFNNKQQYMMEMIEILLLQVPEASQKMEVAIATENWDEMFFQSHRIKSTFKIVGLHELVNVCMAIEGRTRIIAPEELHLVPDFFKQFQILSKAEVPNLEKAFEYLKERCEQERSKLPTDDSDSTFLL